jgi:hypothetical protein
MLQMEYNSIVSGYIYLQLQVQNSRYMNEDMLECTRKSINQLQCIFVI